MQELIAKANVLLEALPWLADEEADELSGAWDARGWRRPPGVMQRQLRLARIETPILILSGADDTDSKLKGFGKIFFKSLIP